jgi:hypothetical protein
MVPAEARYRMLCLRGPCFCLCFAVDPGDGAWHHASLMGSHLLLLHLCVQQALGLCRMVWALGHMHTTHREHTSLQPLSVAGLVCSIRLLLRLVPQQFVRPVHLCPAASAAGLLMTYSLGKPQGCLTQGCSSEVPWRLCTCMGVHEPAPMVCLGCALTD